MAVSEERLQQEIARLNRAGIDDAEFKVAQRNLHRLCKNNSTLVYTDDMTTLYVAMKNLNGAKFRLNVPTLQVWKERFSKESTYKSVFYVVEKSRLPVLPAQARQYLVVLEDEGLTLPQGMQIENSWILDSSCPRALPGKGVCEFSSVARSTSTLNLTSGNAGVPYSERDIQTKEARATLDAPEAGPSRKRKLRNHSSDPAEPMSLTEVMEQTVAATANAIENERWVACDDLDPSTVEFWIEDFKRLLQSGLYRDGGRKEELVLPASILKYMRFVFKHLLTSTWRFLEALRPAIEQVLAPVSYTHLTLPTKRIV